MTREECMKRRDDPEMIIHPEWWPAYPYMPLVRRTGGVVSPEHHYGVLVALGGEQPEPIVWITLLPTLLGCSITPETPKIVYNSVAALVADGWRVD